MQTRGCFRPVPPSVSVVAGRYGLGGEVRCREGGRGREGGGEEGRKGNKSGFLQKVGIRFSFFLWAPEMVDDEYKPGGYL